MKDNNSLKNLILIHGAGGNSNIWNNQFYLNIDYNIIALDLPSHNKSNTFKEITLDLYIDVIRKLANSINPKKLILGGHSMGGVVAQEFFYRHPTEVSALILCSTGAKMRVSNYIFNSLRNNFQEYLDFLRVNSFYEKTSKDIIDDSILETSQTNPEVTHSDFEICNKFDTLTKTDSIEVPCLIICGKADKLTPVKYSEYFHEKIKNSELCIIENSGHSVMIEKPKRVNIAIENFIKNF